MAKARRRSKQVEIIVKVRLPKGVTVKQIRYAVADNWFGEIDLSGYVEPNSRGNTPVIKPRWGKARLAKRA